MTSGGTVDGSFGTGGIFTHDAGGFDVGYDLVTQADSKIVAVGLTSAGAGGDMLVVRVDYEGALDPTFGSGGATMIGIGGGADGATGIAQQADGRYVIAGFATDGGHTDVVLIRLNADGSPDPTFGTTGQVRIDQGGADDMSLKLFGRADDGVVLIAATDDGTERLMLVQLEADGSPTPGFGTDGVLVTDTELSADATPGAALLDDGSLLVATGVTGAGKDVMVAKFLPDGTPDTSFGTDGSVVVDRAGGDDTARSLQLQLDGKILIGGTTGSGAAADMAVLRLHASGTVDTGFGTDGWQTIDPAGGADDGFVVLAGTAGQVTIAGTADMGGHLDIAIASLSIEPDPGYWLLDSGGAVYSFGGASDIDVDPLPEGRHALAIEATSTGFGFWVLDSEGEFHHYGDAFNLVDIDMSVLSPLVDYAIADDAPEEIVAVDMMESGAGVYIFTSAGRVIVRGYAPDHGGLTGTQLNSPIIHAGLDPDGDGYWMLAADGGVFAFEAAYHGSIPEYVASLDLGITAEAWLNQPVVGMTPDPLGMGYWMIAADGGVFSFGDVPFQGSIPGVLPDGVNLNAPIIGMVAYGDGYLMLGSDGGVFNFSDLDFDGSLGDNPPEDPVVDLAPLS